MRVLVTGASGGIGSAVTKELRSAGHDVLGLARSARAAAAVTAAGATPLSGDLDDADTLRTGAAESDGVVHVAFSNDFSSAESVGRAVEQEAAALRVFGAALAGSGKPLVIAGGTPVTPGRLATERDASAGEGPLGARVRTHERVLALADQGVRSAVVRLPRSVHARGDRYGFASILIEAARRTGVSGFVGDGSQRWPAVNRFDAATLFRLVLEQAEPGSVAHAVADEGDPMRALADAIGRELELPVRSVEPEHFGVLGSAFAVDQPASSEWTRQKFGWQPTHPSLLADLEAGGYPQ